MKPIEINKKGGPVVFLGGINAMPMMYAIELRKLGVDVLYFVDRPQSDSLSRPENHFSDIEYPYPGWIIESLLPSQIFLPLFPRFFSYFIVKKILKLRGVLPQVFVLNGLFCSLAPYLTEGSQKLFLPGGSDLDSWADTEHAAVLCKTFSGRSIFKYLPAQISRLLINKISLRQFNGAANCHKVVYFPRGFNKIGDRVLTKLEREGVDILARYDVSFEPLKGEERGKVKDGRKLVIFSGVRFLFSTFPDGNVGYGKGNDLIMAGLAEYSRLNKNIEINFVEKGEDVSEAKRLCVEFGISEFVKWHKEMKFKDLLGLYKNADICFDQVGEHWIGAIGFYALWLGKPLIANDARAVSVGLWDKDAPILSASTPSQIKDHLVALESVSYRRELAVRSMEFAQNTLGPERVLQKLFLVSE